MSKYDDLARIIIQDVGGRANIASLTHCATRLRFRLWDESKAQTSALSGTAGVVTVIRSGRQYMVVIGRHVTEVYDAVCRAAHLDGKGRPAGAAPPAAAFLARLFHRGRKMEPTAADGILIYAPVSGRVRPLPRIEDPVFSSEALGKGCAIEPSGDAIVAPFDGVVEQIAQTKHAVGLRSETGVELLIHVGMDTVELKGLGFAPQVQVGDRVKQGQLLLKFNRTAIAAAGYRVTTPVVVTNTAAFKSVQVIASGTVIEGQKLLLLLENSYPSARSGARASGCGRVPTQSGSPQDYDSQDAIERACADLIALSEELTDRGILHDVGWWAKETQKIQTAEIRSAEDLIQALGALLGATLEERKKTIWERFSREYGENSFSQVIIIDDETAKTYKVSSLSFSFCNTLFFLFLIVFVQHPKYCAVFLTVYSSKNNSLINSISSSDKYFSASCSSCISDTLMTISSGDNICK